MALAAPVLLAGGDYATPTGSGQTGLCMSERGVSLVVAFEVGNPEIYTRRYRNPIYPGGSSGPTVGVGYDLGHQRSAVILQDWERHPHAVRMATGSGVIGPVSRDWVRRYADISVDWSMARQVFDQTSVVEHCRLARRAFPLIHRVPLDCQSGIVSVVFNRGASMAGDGRREMRSIRDVCLPVGDSLCVAREIRSMARINRGSAIEAGITRRRNAEAALCEATR